MESTSIQHRWRILTKNIILMLHKRIHSHQVPQHSLVLHMVTRVDPDPILTTETLKERLK